MEKIIRFEDYAVNGEFAYTMSRAIAAAKAEGATRIDIPTGVYKITPDWCAEKSVCISNHGWNGPHRFIALIEDMADLTLDFHGSTLDCEGIITPFAILRSRNISIENVTLDNPNTGMIEARVLGQREDGGIELEVFAGRSVFALKDERLYYKFHENSLFCCGTNIEFNPAGEIEAGTGDVTMGTWLGDMRFVETEEGHLLAYGAKRVPPVGNILVISATRRLGSGVFCEESCGITCKNVIVNGCFGMGFIAQMCSDIHLDNFSSVRAEGRYHAADADATHFVNCSGKVLVENCLFEGMLDDALNIHGIYTRIVGKGEKELLVREMHNQATGIRIYRPGDRVQALKPAPLIPYAELTVRTVEYINGEIIRLTFEESVEGIEVGDDIENISHETDLVFRNNTVRNNRARGMLIANRGTTVIENCYFHTSGTAVKFESDGEYWFESGGTTDVVIRNNKFDGCKHGGWGTAVIECQARRETLEGKYFHQAIRVLDNEFIMYNKRVCLIDNVGEFVFEGNTVTPTEEGLELIVRHNATARVQNGVEISE